jgi:pyruvate dehydrogenase E1 component alpha subunit
MAGQTPAEKTIAADRFLRHYDNMVRIRAFEEAALSAAEAGLLKGALHLSIGQEAVASGICGNLEIPDILLSTHRGHGHTLVKGADPFAMISELLGREGGTCRGKGGSMHIADFSVGMLGANGVVGANISIAAGAAHAIKLKGEKRIVACIFGDGAINRGPFLEGLNWARIFDLPILFVCEDNGFAATTRTAVMSGGAGPVARAESLGIPAAQVDGNDIVAIDEAARERVARIRRGGGPHFLLAKTYRLTGHTSFDPAAYRPAEEVEAAWQQDPIIRCRRMLVELGVPEEQLEEQKRAAEQEMGACLERASAAPWPDLALAYEDVQDTGAPTRGDT